MDDYRGYQQENINTRSVHKKPPSGGWHPTVPSWEKRFCTSVCSIPWGKLCEAKRVMPLFKNVLQWNDSAGEEAFQNAKSRFWAEINGLPCNISLPDPDIYIDEIDWNAEIDPELLSNLDKEPLVMDDGENDVKGGFLGSGWDSFLNGPVPCTGWGDSDEPVRSVKDPVVEPGWGNHDRVVDTAAEPGWENHDIVVDTAAEPGWENHDRVVDNNNVWDQNGWENRDRVVDNNNVRDQNGWENQITENNSCGWGVWERENVNGANKSEFRNNVGDWGRGNWNSRKREGGGRCGSTYKSSRFQREDHYQVNGGWRNCRGRKREGLAYGKPVINGKPSATRQWNSMQFCGPMDQHRSAESGNAWSWDKPVS